MRRLTNSQRSRFETHKQDVLDLLNAELERSAEDKKTRLYDHQIKAVLDAKKYFDKSKRTHNIGLIQVPTGGGKSGIISLLPYALGSQKVIVLSPSKVITGQLETTFGGRYAETSFYIKMGIVDRDILNEFLPHTNTIRSSHQIPDMSRADLVIVNAQKFTRTNRPEIILNGNHGSIPTNIFDNFDTIIVDEAHHYPARTWSDIVQIFNNKKIIFLTATPNPGINLDIIYQIPRAELERLQIIRRIERELLNVNDVNNVNNDELNNLAERMRETLEQQDNLINVVHKAMVLVRKDRDYTREMANRFNAIPDLNFRATFCTSDQPSDSNLVNFKQDPNLRIMVVCQRLTEGYDNSDVSVCVILRNVTSYIIFNQFVGRCIRISQDRENFQDADVVARLYGGPEAMWNRYNQELLATDDPVDEDGDDE